MHVAPVLQLARILGGNHQQALTVDQLLEESLEEDRPWPAELGALLDSRHRHEVLDHPLEALRLRGDADRLRAELLGQI